MMKSRTRPAATPAETLYAMDRMIALAQSGQQDIAARFGLNVTDLTCLGLLFEARNAGDRLGAGELAVRARLTTGAVTGVLNRLEKAGYIRREPDPGDRRRVWATLEDAAQLRVCEVYGPLYERLGALFADYTDDEIAVLADWLTRARAAMRESLDELRLPRQP
ncbi:MarR family transcriptional regulator [Streptomyces sp. NPDC006997]|uniref:MarR family transcriptional regulator n=1 Tax=Streptomyces sp. NPDC006997 TaxID=3155356 RepID=UPI0033C9F931